MAKSAKSEKHGL